MRVDALRESIKSMGSRTNSLESSLKEEEAPPQNVQKIRKPQLKALELYFYSCLFLFIFILVLGEYYTYTICKDKLSLWGSTLFPCASYVGKGF